MHATASEIAVRKAEDSELERVIAVLRRANAEFEALAPPSFYRAYLTNVLDVRSRWADSELLVAEVRKRGGIVGAITLYPDASREDWGWPPHWAGIRAVAVEPDARGRGVGRALAEACIERAGALGAPTVCLHTAPFMEAAIRMYEGVGFRRAPQYDGDADAMVGAETSEQSIVALAYQFDLQPSAKGDRDGNLLRGSRARHAGR
jgi:ribosomal protein S18 acetylase RimI-like enzyme